MEEIEIITSSSDYVDYDPDPIVSEIREMEKTLHDDITSNTLVLESVYQNTYYSVVADLWISALLAVLIGIGLVLVFKR